MEPETCLGNNSATADMSKKAGNATLAEVKSNFVRLHKKALALGLKLEDFDSLDALKEIRKSKNFYWDYIWKTFSVILAFALLLSFMWCWEWPVSLKSERFLAFWFRLNGIPEDDIYKESCVVESVDAVRDIFRPPIHCSFCQGVKEVKQVSGITPEEFEQNYAYTGHPVVITDGTENWTAPNYFSFEFFKDMYKEGSPALENTESNCQFFPYKTSFNNLGEVFNMKEERAHMKDGSEPWYIGWSNCDITAGNILRQHYTRPYFLPQVAESSRTDWIFMGSPGYGAHLHLDNVGLPSWQAQITGTKKWTLEPPSECYYDCVAQIQVTVHPGEIIVLDTNKWFHSTLNVGNDISITIGSEFD